MTPRWRLDERWQLTEIDRILVLFGVATLAGIASFASLFVRAGGGPTRLEFVLLTVSLGTFLYIAATSGSPPGGDGGR